MKKYIQTLPPVLAYQWKESIGHEQVKFGVSSTTNRFDDTPDGYYINIYPPGRSMHKRVLKENDWMIFDETGTNVVGIVDEKTFKDQFKVEIPSDIKSDMDLISYLDSDLGFMGSPSYDAAKKRIEEWKNIK